MKRWIVGALVAVALAGIYQSRIVHGVWLSRNLYTYGYEPNQERIALKARADALKQDIEAFQGKAKAQPAPSSVNWGLVGLGLLVPITAGGVTWALSRRRKATEDEQYIGV